MTIATRAITGLRRLLDGLLLALVVVSLGVVVLGRLLPLSGHPTLVVAGPSMGAAVPIGSAVILDQVPPTSLAVGDVVTLRSGADRAIFTHRIIRVADREGAVWLETKGDANADPDPSLTSSDAVMGRVGLWIPYAGYLLTLYSVPSGVIFVVSLGMVLLLLGISLEPHGARRQAAASPAVDPDAAPRALTFAPVNDVSGAVAEPTYSVADRPAAKEVVRASRERRARHRSSARGPGPSRRHGS